MPESENKDRAAAIRGTDWLIGFCKACGHGARLTTAWAIRVAGREVSREALARRLKCHRCGARAGLVIWAERPLGK